jgi:hypothetical protein
MPAKKKKGDDLHFDHEVEEVGAEREEIKDEAVVEEGKI